MKTEILDPDDTLKKLLRRTTLITQSHSHPPVHRLAMFAIGDVERIRWDPRSCPPTDPSLVDVVESLPASGSVDWVGDTWVIVDNFRCLHRRLDATFDPGRKLVRYYSE
ncbi:hypothetical protein AYL44_03645 [Microbacterium oleivorans]|uniref:TauD/TfdA-like domain-containing protein n=1 Tax=Microbacterium oleivorans TaxID=273677 RepID=A0A177KD82_9MICO|nr:hypothetical protein AYL44_03645 [Microbacterium oleivorans]